jgi:predicted transcriptional regulator
MSRDFLVVDPDQDLHVLKALASESRVRVLRLLHDRGGMNVNDIAAALNLPQSTISANVQALEEAGLIRTESRRARKGNQKICHPTFDQILVMFREDSQSQGSDTIDVSMPLGLYTRCEVTAPCGLCSPEGIIGLLDVPNAFLDPERMHAGLIWFTRGFLEYQFPNNAKLSNRRLTGLEFSMELSSEVPGTASDWPSDITLSVNGIEIGTWTSPGDFGDKRGVFTPSWWKLKGSQYGMLKSWRVTESGVFVDGTKISPVTLRDLDLDSHHSIRLRIEVKEDARHRGGVNVFGKGFGNYDQEILMRLQVGRAAASGA